MLDLLKNKLVKFALVAIIYVIWVIWVGSYWLFIGLAVVFDIYVSKIVNWSFWKKREGPNNTIIEWLDALIFAVIAVTLINIFLFQNYRIPTGSMEKSLRIGDHLFVSKVAYGPRMPNTPVAFPFTQHTIPLIKTKSWSNIITRPYKRLSGFGEVERFNVVVFNFPAGDTVVVGNATAYEEIVRQRALQLESYDSYTSGNTRDYKAYLQAARQQVWDESDIVVRPVDRRENYVKRCVGIPGDSIEVKGGLLHVNGEAIEDNGTQQMAYRVNTNGTRINPKAFERLDVPRSGQRMVSSTMYFLNLTQDVAEKISGFANVTEVKPDLRRNGEYGSHIFPHNPEYPWNEDYFGPLWIPAAGETVELDSNNISIYRRIIDVYEDNDLEETEEGFFINGERATSYTFKMNYYWMMGDNRHDSADSRYWGFVPEDHVVGKPVFIWLSIDKEAKGFKRIRFNRMFRSIH
ncbi:MAG: S26 family signal peptidase [Marinilabiliaceae bacterium]|jgi:signal peptidase I|nr:S26 family signal peptidase [Marinilabiliaceae bacterium]